MNSVEYSSAAGFASPAHRVLRNTYWLLALSMVPTVAGAWLGLKTGLLSGLGPLMTFVIFLAGAFGLMFMVQKNRNSGAGVGWLLAFTGFMGLMLSNLLGAVLARSGGAQMVMTAFAATSAIFGVMAVLSSVVKRDLRPLGYTLTIGAVLLIVGMLANIFIQSSAFAITLSLIAAGIFSVFILVDLKAVRDGYETSYVSAALGVYLSLYNVFSNLLALLGLTSDD